MSASQHDDILPLVYANWFRSVHTPTELALDLGYRGVGDPQPALRLLLAWPYVAELREVLDRLIRQYEAETGEKVPEPAIDLGPAQFVPES
jgi:hypothetical protein